MKREFRLQKILEYRERIVDIEKGKLSELNTKLLENKNNIRIVQKEIDVKVDERETAQTSMLIMFDKYIKKLEDQRALLIKMKKQLEMNIEIQKKKVMDAIERHKIMEKLKERHIENLKAFLNKEEMKLIDELAITRSGRDDD